MEKILVQGSQPLSGEVKISGAKNAVLPIMAATLLANDKSILTNVPNLKDVATMAQVLHRLGANVELTQDGQLEVDTGTVSDFVAHYDLVKTMRASFLVFGSLLARFGMAKVALPGGCAIGSRPIDLHLKGFEELGGRVRVCQGYVEARVNNLKGAQIHLDFPSVGATENIMMAATLADGKTRIHNVACEPEVIELANFLNYMGARVFGAGGSVIEIEGVYELHGTNYEVIPDRIEAGTYMVAAAITRGEIEIKSCNLDHLEAVVTKLEEAGVEIEPQLDGARVRVQGDLKPINVKTRPYPGFPTDMQAQVMALMAVTPGSSIITETIFENRFMHVGELNRMGADIRIEGHSAIVKGVKYLSGVQVMATDLRASVALLLAGLVAEGQTEISHIYHLDRGYEHIEEKLANLGAKIQRVKE